MVHRFNDCYGEMRLSFQYSNVLSEAASGILTSPIFSQQSLRLDIGNSVHFHASDFLASKSAHASFKICSMELQKRPSIGGSACTLRVKFYIYITGQIGVWPLPVVSSNN